MAMLEIAASCTATGRKSLIFARDYIATNYGAQTVYGVSKKEMCPVIQSRYVGQLIDNR